MSLFAFPLLAQAAPDPRSAWLPVILLIILAVGFVVATLATSIVVGPSRTGPGKQRVYESGMMPIGDARRRFNVRFYLVAMIFLVLDVGIVFFYLWTTLFPGIVFDRPPESTVLLVEILIFISLLLLAYFYAWGKGVFRWD
jgi:NADH-quinone oxidoreductase subunit A